MSSPDALGSPDSADSVIHAAAHASDSDLSDAGADPTSRSASPNPSQISDNADNDDDSAGTAQSSDGNASEDDDFEQDDDDDDNDIDNHHAAAESDESTDENFGPRSSSKPLKRKATKSHVSDHITANPALYGLRRSGRATQQRTLVVDSSSESESDIATTTRRNVKRRRLDDSQTSSKRGTPVLRIPDQDSESSDYGGARAKTLTRKARRKQEAESSAGYAEKRWSSRRAAQVQQGAYEESDLEDDEQDVYSDQTPNYVDVVDEGPRIEKVVRHRLKEDTEFTTDSSREDFEYYIKWTGKSHLHDTWEPIEELRGLPGFRKVENYFRKVIDYELDIRFGYDIPPESKEQYYLDREREEEALEDFTKVERIVAIRNGDNGKEYFVKWKGLFYDECTWEEAEAIVPAFQDKIDQFLDRSTRSWHSRKDEMNPTTRSRMEPLEAQPEYIKGGELRPFQLRGLNFLCINWTRANNVILADEMGLGKTVQSVSFLSWLRNDRRQEGPFLVVAPLSVIPAWCDTFNFWAPDMNYVVYTGPDKARSIIRENELLIDGNCKKPKFNVLVTSYEYILADQAVISQIKWQSLVVDEAHRLKNPESQLYIKLVSLGVPCKILITGTPIQNNLSELSALLDFLNPGKVTIDGDLDLLAGSDAQERLQDLHRAIAPFILRRTKETVESDLPPKTEKIIRVELSDVQLDYYKNILTRNYAALCDATSGYKNSLLNIMMELKKASNHPYIFMGAEEKVLGGSTRREDQIKGLIASSGKMMLLDQLLTKLKKDNHRVLIFSQMVKMLDILGDYLALRGYKFQRLDGTIAAGPRRMAINHFNAEDSDDFCFLLSTRAGGLGINLMTADTVIIFDSDWNPQADLQAMARAHRIGQKRPVNIYRLVSKETVEEEVLERARNKLLLEYLTIQAGVTDEGTAFREQFNKKGLKVDGPTSAEDIQWVLKMRSQKMFEQSGNQERLEQLDIDSILENAEVTKTKVDDKMNLSSGGIDWDNFMQYTDVKVDDLALDWDEIIPADQLAAIKHEEEERKSREMLAKLEAESAPRRARNNNGNGHGNSKSTETDRADRAAKKRHREEQLRLERTDPRRALNVQETRNLIRAFNRYGDVEMRFEEMVEDAKLADRDREFLKTILERFVQESQKLVDDNNARLVQDEKRTGKAPSKKDQKALLFEFDGVKGRNAMTAIERPLQLRLLRKAIQAEPNWKSFRVPEATKSPQYTCTWGAREDGMLLAGVDKYGFGAWVQIRDDAEFELQEKFFLDEHRVEKKEERTKGAEKVNSPGATHLARRAELLLALIQAREAGPSLTSNGGGASSRSTEVTHRKKSAAGGSTSNGHHRRSEGNSLNASPLPHLSKKHHDRASSNPRADFKRKHSGQEEGHNPSPKHRRLDESRNNGNNTHSHNGTTTSSSSNNKKMIRHAEDRESSSRTDKRRNRDDDRIVSSKKHRIHEADREDSRKSDSQTDERRLRTVRRLEELSRMANDKEERLKDNDAMVWLLLKPVWVNFNNILSATKISSKKERASIFGVELLVIGNFIDQKFKNNPSSRELKKQFWDLLASLWPADSNAAQITGERLGKMYQMLHDREKDKENSKSVTASASLHANGTPPQPARTRT